MAEVTLIDDQEFEDADEEKRAKAKPQVSEDFVLEFDGFRCPEEFVNTFTPLEFEELVTMFNQYDVNKSGDIDIHEARKILLQMDLEHTLEKAQELMDKVDKDGSGAIEFPEFCEFVALMKLGDEKFAKFTKLLENLNNTPLGFLDVQAKLRKLISTFQIIEEREATATTAAMSVVELSVSGMWHYRDNGMPVSKQETKRFQGIATNTRDAKYQAAKKAINKFKSFMPGMIYEEGFFPEEWIDWLDKNLCRSVPAVECIDILRRKGFHPTKNIEIMHKLSCHHAIDCFLQKYPDFDANDMSKVTLDARFVHWVKSVGNMGIDGGVFLKVLEDRNLEVIKYHPHLAQKIKNNELSKLVDHNGQVPKFLDFWQACEDGNITEVMLYLRGDVDVNLEKMGRFNSIALTPLMLAASKNRYEVIKLLCEKDVNVHAVDKRGRTALHIAGINGATESCKVLMDAGSRLFEGDVQGNTALHLAAAAGHVECVDALAFKGQEFTRAITSDKVTVNDGVTFDELARKVFALVMNEKLKAIETKRFQKDWLHDSAVMFRNLMDANKRHMIAPTCAEIMVDVLNRFDPRPETGIYVSTATEGEKLFIPTIQGYSELSLLLRYMFRQSALDNTNSWNRTALHLACAENVTVSHKEVILLLTDKHGCNVSLVDMHGRTPYQLLVQDKRTSNGPTATRIKEMSVYEQRQQILNDMQAVFDEEDREITRVRRKIVLDACIKRADSQSLSLWDATREASHSLGRYGGGVGNCWRSYEDADTKNVFYGCMPADPTIDDPWTGYSWSIPLCIRTEVLIEFAWTFHRLIMSKPLRVVENWMTLKCVKTNVTYYYHMISQKYQFKPPPCYDWKNISFDAKYLATYGYSEEYQSYSKDENVFYYNAQTKKYYWEQPRECVVVKPEERYCTAYRSKKAIDQKWYTCEQCNRDSLKELVGEGEEVPTKNVMIKICEPCVYRCHRGHRGIRLVRMSPVTCQCQKMCSAFCECKALEISRGQLITLREAADYKQEEKRQRVQDAFFPPLFAAVPKLDNDGRLKRESGWTVCRRCSPMPTAEVGKVDVDVDGDTVVSDSTSAVGSIGGLNQSSIESIDSHVPESCFERISREYFMLAVNNFEALISPLLQKAAKQGWIEVIDPEEPEVVPIGSRVLCYRQDKIPKYYGTVVSRPRADAYTVEFSSENDKEILPRAKIELMTKRTFFFNQFTGECLWTLPPLDENLNSSERPLVYAEQVHISGNTWHKLKLVAEDHRSYSIYDELQDPVSKLLFYVDVNKYALEVSALKIQKWYRHLAKIPCLYTFQSNCFTFEKPTSVYEEERTKSGWALLKRRSLSVGEFYDIENMEWEEFMDADSADFFYYQEDTDTYSWDKPEIPSTKVMKKIIQVLEIGEEVTYRFPHREVDDVVIVTRLRKDDETNEDMYDIVHKRNDNIKAIWVPRFKLKKIAKSGDDLKLELMAGQWKRQIRRQREKEKRNRDKIRQAKLQAELAKRAKTMSLQSRKMDSSMSVGGESHLSMEQIEKSRASRARAEKKELLEIKNAVVIRKKKEGIDRLLKDINTGTLKLSKSEQISMTRAITMKLEVEAKLEKRQETQQKLLYRSNQVQKRLDEVESVLRSREDLMTSPRSQIRRKLLRACHVAEFRQYRGLVICEWGCGDWVMLGQEQQDHQRNYCLKRIVPCPTGCDLKLSEEEWLREHVEERDIEKEENENVMKNMSTVVSVDTTPVIPYQQYHEESECPKRLIPCPRQCLEWIVFDQLQHHMDIMCIKRPAQELICTLGCGESFGGEVAMMIEAENDRQYHEQNICMYRQVRCNWRNKDGSMCAAQINAMDRNAHRDEHIEKLGISTYTYPGVYLYKVGDNVKILKIQLWGAGGGSGHFKDRKAGSGGGGAFVEALLYVEPHQVFEVRVGSGGQAGAYGSELRAVHTSSRDKTEKVTNTFDLIEGTNGMALGGVPGGGQGCGGGGNWAGGGGGGYSMISKRSSDGNSVIAVAGGGGGGCSADGLPGAGFDGAIPGARLDIRNGGCGSSVAGGIAGDSGNMYNSQWPASAGEMWQGGNSSQFGGGGGGGYYGGGGGGTSPGIGGGGGGGSSFIYTWNCKDYLAIAGTNDLPGGMSHDVPQAIGVGEWDKKDGVCGQGGIGDKTKMSSGNGGAVRILAPGYF